MAQGRLPSLEEWLESLDLLQYQKQLVNAGLSTVEQVNEVGLDDSFLSDIGISLMGHRKRILEHIPATRITPGNLSQEENIYENVENSPELEDQDEDIYVNYTCNTSEKNDLPKSKNNLDSRVGNDVKKKPVPRPRLSKLTNKEKGIISKSGDKVPQSSSPPVARPRKNSTKQFVHVTGVTSDSTSDFDPFAAEPSSCNNSSNKYSDDLFKTLQTDFNNTAIRPSGFSDHFTDENNRISDNYDAIWTTSEFKQPVPLRKSSDSSPFTPPFLPNPCTSQTFAFKDEENKEKMENEPSECETAQVGNASPKHLYVNQESDELKSPPPPSFPPPALPHGEAFPPVPPRISKDDRNSPFESNDEELYSEQYVKKGLFTSTKMKTLTSTSDPDPFDGDDPFKDFQQECTDFNKPKNDDPFSTGKKAFHAEDTFDPFGIYEMESEKQFNDPLEQVPPPPEWHETIQQPKNAMALNSGYSVYSLAEAIPPDVSSDLESSEGELSDSDETQSIGHGVTSPMVDIVASPYPKKSKQKSGYLWKQGGVKANRGWRKRWVVFDGKTLRYYSNHKSQISKRVIPLACMQRVELKDIKEKKDGDRFKFNLINQNRVFLFAAETLDECTLWANTLMEAIITYDYEKPKDGEKEGLDMNSPDKMGFVKFERRGEMFLAIKGGKLAYYESQSDYKIGSPINEIDMKLASVKEVGKNRLQLSTHYGHFILLFTDQQDCVFWRMAMEDAIADGLGDNTVLESVRENQSNDFCADCGSKDPHWASINMGIVVCKNCAGIHRDFDHRISKVKSLRMDTKVWTPSLIEMMRAIGNENSKQFWEHRLQPVHKINEDTSPGQRKQFIMEKYEQKLWINQHPYVSELNEELLRTVTTGDILKTMRILFSGANILYAQKNTGKTAFDLAKDAGQRLQMEFLYHNGGDKSSRASADIDEALALRMRAEISMEGHLLKTGPKNRTAFMDRYCVIEHGCLRYFINEKSSAARDSVDNESMLCVQSVTNLEKTYRQTANFDKFFQNIVHIGSKMDLTHDGRSVLNLRVRQLSVRKSVRPDVTKRYPHAFEISTLKPDNNRIYLFAATTYEEKMTWMRTLGKLFCPVHFIKEMHDKEFSLAGNFYMKAGVASEWEKTWILVDKKVVKYLNENQQLEEIDLRKVSNIQFVDGAVAQPCSYAVENGKCFTLDIPGRSLYFQADLSRDTVRLYEAFGSSMKGGGPTLEDQQLTPENIPVIVSKCIKFIEENGIKEKGVYRTAAQDSKVQNLLTRFLADAHSLILRMDTNSVSEVHNCLKRFFRFLKDPLFTKTSYQDWINYAAMENVESKLAHYKFQLKQLPDVNRCTVRQLVLHLARISSHCKDNLMDVKNIALAFGPTLMRGNEPIQQEKIAIEMRVVEDLITYHKVLFEEEVQKNQRSESILQEVEQKIKMANLQHRNSNFTQIEELKVNIYFQHKTNQSEDFTAKRYETVADAVKQMKIKFKLSLGQWVLYEVVYSDVLERPLHPSECLLDVVMSWSKWEEEYRKNTHLVLKSAERLLQLNEVYDPNHALFAEFKYKEKKERGFKKCSFGFNQSNLQLFKDCGYNTLPSKSWKIEDILVYFGADPKKNALKYAFSFIVIGEKIGKGDMPLFGRTICCNTENELISWMAAMLKAKHPDGFLVS